MPKRGVFYCQHGAQGGATPRLPAPLIERDKATDFAKWFDLFLLAKGCYKLTAKAIEELGTAERKPELSASEKKRIAGEKVNARIAEGKAEEIYDAGYVTRPDKFWGDQSNRIAATKKLVEVQGNDPRAISSNDFISMKLHGLLHQAGNSAYAALAEAGFAYPLEEVLAHSEKGAFGTDRIYPWEMQMSPMVFKKSEFRVAATRWLVWKKGNDPRNVLQRDFEAEIRGVLPYCGESGYSALVESGHAYSMEETMEHARRAEFRKERIYAWEMANAPHIYGTTEWRAAATRWLVWKTGKKPHEMQYDEFETRLRGLLPYCRDSHYIALAEAGYAYMPDEVFEHAETGLFRRERIYPWEMNDTPSIYGDCQFRIAATRWLIWKTGKNPRDITTGDFTANGIAGLLASQGNAMFNPFVEAGYAYSMEEALRHAKTMDFREGKMYAWEMNNVRIYGDEVVRAAATRWLVWKIGKGARDITYSDFREYGLARVVELHDNSPFFALKEADLVTEADENYMRRR